MRGRFGGRVSGLAVSSGLLGLLSLGAAQAGAQSIEADSGRASRAEATKLARSIGNPKQVRSAAFAARPPYGPIAGLATKRLAGFPLSGGSYLILGNGDVRKADNKNSSGSTSTNAGGPTIRGARDVTIFRINLQVPRGKNCLSFRFRFLSEEFPEFVNTEFNDGFIAEVGETTWDTNTIGSPTITAPRNFAFNPRGNRISVNGVGDTTVTKSAAKGTTYDGATRRLRASTRIRPGKRRLYLSIFDQGDRQYDSAVFVDRLTLTTRSSSRCRSGAVRD